MKLYPLFIDGRNSFPLDGNMPSGPYLTTLDGVVKSVRQGASFLQTLIVDEILDFVDEASQTWSLRGHVLQKKYGRLGLNFLLYWFRKENLLKVLDLSLRGNRKVLDGFAPIPGSKGEFLAVPRGIVGHWLPSNVPLLGALSLVHGLLTKNGNILKPAKSNLEIIPEILESLASFNLKSSRGIIRGSDIVRAMAAVYIDDNDEEGQSALSQSVDVRVIWGGKEAVTAITNLPKRTGCEDVLFGPRTSFMVIGKEYLSKSAVRKLLPLIARDCSYFDQKGCNSAQTIFLEEGGKIAVAEFINLLGKELENFVEQLPVGPLSPEESLRITSRRVEYDMRPDGLALYPADLRWTILYDSVDVGLAEPCFHRTVFVRTVQNIVDVANYCSSLTQTVGVALWEKRRRNFCRLVMQKGVDRCVNVGLMTLYDIPWDGTFVMDRFVRWCKL